MIRIALTGGTRKMLVGLLQQAYADHATRLIRRIHALLELAAGAAVDEVAEVLGVGEQRFGSDVRFHHQAELLIVKILRVHP